MGQTKESCLAAYLLSKKVLALKKKSGLLFLALHLKQCGSCLQKADGGAERKLSKLKSEASKRLRPSLYFYPFFVLIGVHNNRQVSLMKRKAEALQAKLRHR